MPVKAYYAGLRRVRRTSRPSLRLGDMRAARHDGQLSPPAKVQGDIHELVDLR